MRSVCLHSETDFAAFRTQARALLSQGVAPEDVSWETPQSTATLFAQATTVNTVTAPSVVNVPRAFLELAQQVILHRDPSRFALLYRLLWRLRTEPRLLSLSVDPDVAQAEAMVKAVRRDIHKMHAFVRFREVTELTPRAFLAWFEPEHRILTAAAPFFVRRFPNMRWSILTPEESAHWDLQHLTFGPGGRRRDAPADDAAEALWRAYYASIFNPARLNVTAMRSQMPKKYWRNLPESALIPELVASAEGRTQVMMEKPATHPVRRRRSAQRSAARPSTAALEALREEAARCRDCPLWQDATQTVFGEGPHSAKVVLVGEQPGDQEDLTGQPFVGPAGQLLDRALADAGVDRKRTYVTNAVKHFKFELRGKRRLHKTPGQLEVAACHQWLERELATIQPDLIVAMGARAVFGRVTQIQKNRGRIIAAQNDAGHVSDLLVTVHPSYLLRVPDEDKDAAYREFVRDLRLIEPYIE